MKDLIFFYLYRYISHQHWYGIKKISLSLKLLTIIKYHLHTIFACTPIGNTE